MGPIAINNRLMNALTKLAYAGKSKNYGDEANRHEHY